MNFTPMSEKELAEANLLPAGEYDFEVFEAVDTISRAGNEMIALKLWVFNANGRKFTVRDWLVANNVEKIASFCRAVGLDNEYHAGTVAAEDMQGRTGRAKIKVNPAGQYPASNGVSFYVKPKAGGATAPAPALARKPALAGIDDEIPF